MNFIRISFALLTGMVLAACDATEKVSACNEITPGEAFNAVLNDPWCLNGEELQITLTELIEDSRCNPTDTQIQCFWEGQVVLAVDFEYLDEVQRDTFVARYGVQDTLQIGLYDVRLQKTFPELRDFDNLPELDAYRFELVVE